MLVLLGAIGGVLNLGIVPYWAWRKLQAYIQSERQKAYLEGLKDGRAEEKLNRELAESFQRIANPSYDTRPFTLATGRVP